MSEERDGGRRSIRLHGHDYTLPGEYFVTICTRDRAMLLAPRPIADLVTGTWNALPGRWRTVETDAFVVMPNHLHGIIVLRDAAETVGAMNCAPTLGDIIRVFKASATRAIRRVGDQDFGWQRNYYEHIIQTEGSLAAIRQYIHENPERWDRDPENPQSTPDLREMAFWRRYGRPNTR